MFDATFTSESYTSLFVTLSNHALSFFVPTNVSGFITQRLDLPSWQQASDHLTDKFESNKNTPGLVKAQSQPDRSTVNIIVGI